MTDSLSKELIIAKLKELAGDRFPTLDPSANKNKAKMYQDIKSYLYTFFGYDFISSLDLKESYCVFRENGLDVCWPSLVFSDNELPFDLHFRLPCPHPYYNSSIYFYIGRGHYKHWQEKAYLINKSQDKTPQLQLLESMADYLTICHR